MSQLRLRIDLHEWAARNNTSIRRIALAGGLAPSSLYKTLNGNQGISADIIVGLITATGLRFEELFDIRK